MIHELFEAYLQKIATTKDIAPLTTDLQQYQLARDKERRHIRPLARYAYAYMVAYALISTEDISIEEPNSYIEALKSEHNSNWINAIDFGSKSKK